MIDNQPNEQNPAFLNAKQAAEWLGLKPNTLAKMRVYGNGPAYRKHGQRVLYSQKDLQEWSDGRRRSSTSETPDV
ncbi:MAG: helix-turn-helix domain-containing protein [Hyphomicrobiales bacterium]|nr:helix-turn-helix domain-containing protein [Hyphomicrobiales bacterium]